jgi:hypothetical protein
MDIKHFPKGLAEEHLQNPATSSTLTPTKIMKKECMPNTCDKCHIHPSYQHYHLHWHHHFGGNL